VNLYTFKKKFKKTFNLEYVFTLKLYLLILIHKFFKILVKITLIEIYIFYNLSQL
jgi:hypothetical protein